MKQYYVRWYSSTNYKFVLEYRLTKYNNFNKLLNMTVSRDT